MKSFGETFKASRKKKKLTLRAVGKKVGKSIGYLSDIEHGRKNPPKLDLVSKIEEALGITDGKLVELARTAREKLPVNIENTIKTRPALKEVLLRADEISDEDLNELLDKMNKKD